MPVLGYDTAGASDTGSSGVRRGSVWTADAIGGLIKKFHVAIAGISGTPEYDYIKLGVADCDAGGDPTGENVIEQTELVAAVGDDINIEASGDHSIEANEKYYLCKIPKHSTIHVKYDNSGGTSWYKSGTTYEAEIVDPITISGSLSWRWSIWIDYQHPGVLGYDTAGASQRGNDNIARGTPSKTDGIGGIIKTWHCAIGAIGSPADVKLAVYNCDQGTGDPSTKDLVEQVEYVVAVSDDESEPATNAESVEADTWYLLCIIMKNANTLIKYDNFGGDKAYWYKVCVYADQYPDPADAGWTSGAASLYSIWVDYEPPTTGILGYDTAGGSSFGLASSYQGASWVTDGIGGFVKSFHMAVAAIGSPAEVKMGIADCDQIVYNPSGKAVLEQTGAFVVIVDDNNMKIAAGDTELAPDTYYYIVKAVASGNTKVKYDSVPPGRWYKLGVVWGTTFLNPLPTAFSFQENIATFSIWITYQHPGILGYSVAGVAGSHGITNQYRGSNDVVHGNGGEIKKFHMSVFSVDAVNKNVKMAVADCAQGDGDPSNGAIIEQIEFQVEVSDDEWTDAAGGNNVLADTKYFIAFAVPDADTKIKYDMLPECWYDWGWAYGDVFPNPLDVAHVKGTNVLYSLWVDYEAAGGEEFVRSISDTIGITDNLLRSVGLVRSITNNIGITDNLLRSVSFARKITDTIGILDVLAATRIIIRKIADTVGITDVLKFTITIVKKVDSFGVCQIVKIEKKLVSTVGRVSLSGVGNVIKSMPYKNSKINEAKENMKPTISRVKGIKNE